MNHLGMLRVIRLGLLILGLSGAFAASAAESAPSEELPLGLERQTFDLINVYRSEHDLPKLTWSPEIAQLARQHSRDMATGEVDFGHGGFGDRMDKLRELFPGMHGGGENVFESDDTGNLAQFAVATWLKSPPHLHNIRGDFNYSGLGLWRSRTGACYFTQIFIKTGE
jgi:uncharacterized protein YkwD